MFIEKNWIETLIEHQTFYGGSLLSKAAKYDFEIYSRQPWLVFNCKENPLLSFRTHDLEIGENEATYWHMAAQKEKPVKFEGFTSIIPYKNSLRGNFKVESEHSVDIIASNNRLEKIRKDSLGVDCVMFNCMYQQMLMLK